MKDRNANSNPGLKNVNISGIGVREGESNTRVNKTAIEDSKLSNSVTPISSILENNSLQMPNEKKKRKSLLTSITDVGKKKEKRSKTPKSVATYLNIQSKSYIEKK